MKKLLRKIVYIFVICFLRYKNGYIFFSSFNYSHIRSMYFTYSCKLLIINFIIHWLIALFFLPETCFIYNLSRKIISVYRFRLLSGMYFFLQSPSQFPTLSISLSYITMHDTLRLWHSRTMLLSTPNKE